MKNLFDTFLFWLNYPVQINRHLYETFVGAIMDEESDDEYDEELEMNLNSFRNEAAKNPPIIVAYDNDNDEEGIRSLIKVKKCSKSLV